MCREGARISCISLCILPHGIIIYGFFNFRVFIEQIELPSMLLDSFLWSNQINVNQLKNVCGIVCTYVCIEKPTKLKLSFGGNVRTYVHMYGIV